MPLKAEFSPRESIMQSLGDQDISPQSFRSTSALFQRFFECSHLASEDNALFLHQKFSSQRTLSLPAFSRVNSQQLGDGNRSSVVESNDGESISIKSTSSISEQVLVGGLGGVIGAFVAQPFLSAKIRRQINKKNTWQKSYK